MLSGFASGQTYTFTNAGATGNQGPSQADINASYLGSNLEGKVSINTQGVQEWKVPQKGNYLIEAWGAQGGSGGYFSYADFSSTGGLGGFAKGSIELEKDSVIYIFVGQQGEGYTQNSQRMGDNKSGGWNGGGNSFYGTSGTGGGGASDVRLGGIDLANRIIVAAGGGGGGNARNSTELSNGGNGGGLTAITLPNSSQFYARSPGAGATQSWGNALGVGADTTQNLSGGGGGGYYGGRSGANSTGGGGGSSYINGVVNGETNAGVNTGHGKVIITLLSLPTYTFTNAGAIGRIGPSQSQINLS